MPPTGAENTVLDFVTILQYLQRIGRWVEERISVPALRQDIFFREWRTQIFGARVE